MHPNYDGDLADFDIAFVTVKEPFQFGENVQAINITASEPAAAEDALVSGWGVLHVRATNLQDFLFNNNKI